MSSRYARPTNSSLYVRNVPYGNPESLQEEMKDLFSKYGPVRDVYVPIDYYSKKPRGFAYIQFEYAHDADDALHYLDHACIGGRELEIEFARGDRKTPHEMRKKDGDDSPPRRRRRSRSRSPRRSRSKSPRRHRSRSSSHRRRRSKSPVKHHSRSKSRSRSGSKKGSSERSASRD